MSENFNAASRCHDLFVKVMNYNGNEKDAYEIWADVFQISDVNPMHKRRRLTKMLALFHDELSQAHANMKQTRISPQKYDPVFEALFDSLDWGNFTQYWDRNSSKMISARLSDTILDKLSLFADLLDNDGEPISDDDLEGICRKLLDIEEEIRSGDLPVEAQDFMLRQIGILWDAIQSYRITGPQVFSEAVIQAMTTYVRDVKRIQIQSETQEFQEQWEKIQKIWIFIKERTDDVETLLALYGGVTMISQVAGRLLGT